MSVCCAQYENTPLHECTPAVTTLLLDNGADKDARNLVRRASCVGDAARRFELLYIAIPADMRDTRRLSGRRYSVPYTLARRAVCKFFWSVVTQTQKITYITHALPHALVAAERYVVR
jgi:hypothetical protein